MRSRKVSSSGVLWLIGMMGSGKTSVGTALAERVDATFVDTDVLIASVNDQTIAEIWEEGGEAAFRRLEADAIAGIATGRPTVVATGGGAVLSPDNISSMSSSGTLVWLSADPATLAARAGADPARPLLVGEGDPAVAMERILAERRPRYEAAADVVIDTNARDLDSIIDELVMLWNGS